MHTLLISEAPVSIEDIVAVAFNKVPVQLSTDISYRSKIENAADFLHRALHNSIPIYGTTTGFGASCVQYLAADKVQELQRRLIEYHQCGTGAYFHCPQVIAIMLTRLANLAKGHSGVHYRLLQTLVKMINSGIVPLVPVEGSVGASGDLTPLAYIAAAMQGNGQVQYNGNIVEAGKALEQNGIAPINFDAKEGLAIINGTSVMTGVLALACADIRNLYATMEMLTAIVVQVLKGQAEAFDRRVHQVKPHPGQLASAHAISKILEGSRLLGNYRHEAVSYMDEEKSHQSRKLPFRIQDVYSIRCAPQIIGVVRDTWQWASKWTEIEINSVADNPLIFADETILMGGNFYGGHIAQAADSLKIAVAQLADLADKQLALIVDDKFSNGLPANLAMAAQGDQGLNHGFKGMQITATALTAEALKNAAPASIFSRVTESCNQDKVSMGTIAARDLARSVELTAKVLAILALAGTQAIDILGGQEQISPATKKFYQEIREVSVPLTTDRPMGKEIEAVAHHLLRKTNALHL